MPTRAKHYNFIDVFAGCGGLSLGLSKAGLQGQFAIEQNEHAFLTFSKNFLHRKAPHKFAWPKWLKKQALDIETLLTKYSKDLANLEGKIDVLAGGPPCQGFSTAGRRRIDDPRNQLFKSYVKLVNLIKPKIVLIENVRGFTMDFQSDRDVNNYSSELIQLLSEEYAVYESLIDLSKLGVPQQRTRYFLIAITPSLVETNPFDVLSSRVPTFLRTRNLQVPVSSWSAISDLETSRGGLRPSEECPGFSEICPSVPRSAYQRMMSSKSAKLTDLRLARHSPEVAHRFSEIIKHCHAEGRLNSSVTAEMRSRYGLKKQALRVLDPDRPSPTITSMPDDLLHYSEPRTLTVRENARLQSFPDWFTFHGKYTTGGHRRRFEVPRFTQVANAVPPLAAEAIGEVLVELLNSKSGSRSSNNPQRIKHLTKATA